MTIRRRHSINYSVLEKSSLFKGIPAKELQECLETVPHHIQCYDKEETIFHLMDPALRIGIILEGHAEAQKSFPNGSQVKLKFAPLNLPKVVLQP